jgi:multidrug transporter EmrE-like cation transporter
VWRGLAVTGGILVEELFLGVPLHLRRLAFVLIIVAGALGLTLTSAG